MNKLRIVHVSRSLDVGGQERLLVEFARWSDRSRFDVTFLSLTNLGPIAKSLEELGCNVAALGQPDGLRPGLVWKLAGFVRQGRFDLVHTHDDKPLIYALPALPLAGFPRWIHTHHHGVLPQVTSRQLWLVRMASYWTGAFVCVSQDSARYMAEQGVPAGRIRVIHNGIDVTRFSFSGPNPTGPAVCVARLSPEKDIANLLHAVALVLPQAPEFRLDIAGDGPLRAELMRLAEDLRLGQAVRFLGEVRDVPALLEQARLFVLPSRTEGISLTILEAMARGLPVVATRVGGNVEVIVPNETGMIVPAAEPQRLAQSLLSMWRQPGECLRLGQAGRRRVESYFDVRSMVRTYEQVYDLKLG